MKNQIQALNDFELNKKETTTTLETILFTAIKENELTKTSMLIWYSELDWIAGEHKLNCKFTPFGFFGTNKDIEKATEILIKSMNYN
jgi:hypothetical protein